MVFDDGDSSAHAGSFCDFEPLCGGWRGCWGEEGFVFIAVPPFFAGVGVHAVVEEGVELGFLPEELPFVRHWMYRCRFVVGIG